MCSLSAAVAAVLQTSVAAVAAGKLLSQPMLQSLESLLSRLALGAPPGTTVWVTQLVVGVWAELVHLLLLGPR
jgi:hypothetical protein